jgi:hypothetical protein
MKSNTEIIDECMLDEELYSMESKIEKALAIQKDEIVKEIKKGCGSLLWNVQPRDIGSKICGGVTPKLKRIVLCPTCSKLIKTLEAMK